MKYHLEWNFQNYIMTYFSGYDLINITSSNMDFKLVYE